MNTGWDDMDFVMFGMRFPVCTRMLLATVDQPQMVRDIHELGWTLTDVPFYVVQKLLAER